jgi:hypothetical protein
LSWNSGGKKRTQKHKRDKVNDLQQIDRRLLTTDEYSKEKYKLQLQLIDRETTI